MIEFLIGLVVGIVLTVAAVALVVYLIKRRMRKQLEELEKVFSSVAFRPLVDITPTDNAPS